MKERPILFNAEMIRAEITGRKTQTRRVFKELVEFELKDGSLIYKFNKPYKNTTMGNAGPLHSMRMAQNYFTSQYSPYGQVGDELWVRETWAVGKCADSLKPSLLHAST